MEFFEDLRARLIALGADPKAYDPIVKREGVDAIRRFIDRLTPRSAPLATDWAEAKTYELACRDRRVAAPHETLDGAEQALLKVFRAKISEAKDQANAAFPPTIFVAPAWALQLLHEGWPGQTANAIFLT